MRNIVKRLYQKRAEEASSALVSELSAALSGLEDRD
jgi:hypothetical protein